MIDVKQISLRRPGRLLRFTGIGIGIGGALFGTALWLWLITPPTDLGQVFLAILPGIAAPIVTVAMVVQGIIPEHTERILGRPARFNNAHDHLNHYTVVRQF